MTTIETYYHGKKLNSLPHWVIFELKDKLRLGQLVIEHYQRTRALEAQLTQLRAETADLTAERDGLRVRIRDVAWAALKYEDATYKVKTYKSNGQYKRQLKIIHNILKAAQAEFGPEQ